LHVTHAATAQFAELPGPPINEEFLLEVTRFAIPTDEIPQRGAATLDSLGQDALDSLGQRYVARLGNRAGSASRVDAGGKQGFAGVNVADADHHGVIHDELLDRHALAT